MNSFFGDTPKERVIYIIVWFFIGLSVYGLFSSVLIHPNIGAALEIAGWVVTLAISIPIIKLMWFGEKSPLRMYNSFLQRAFIALVYLLLVHFIAFTIIERGLPILVHQLLPQEKALKTVTIESVNATDRKCMGGIYIKESTSFLDKKLCGIQLDLSKELKVGDTLTLHGKKSFIGFSYDKIES
ncbi:hypothetical protein ORJ66_20210 [Pseudoalteromonas tunicata]|uniref:hypothetical protein n=1 Tax=Pseudoalteromonas tunicata TaxID=314281 RepID=UPI00273F599B|nr:hypothetical protein [Pseudoalteromonas tunicata]MDP5215380.1 hypothetical protein [Pseudoalteromonas tunicata]